MNDTITESDKLLCVEGQLRFHRQLCAWLVQQGRMSPNDARREISVMDAIVEDYRARAEAERFPVVQLP